MDEQDETSRRRKQTGEPYYVGRQADIARVLGVNLTRVKQMQSLGAPEKNEQGYDLTAWVRWYIDRSTNSHGHDPSVDSRLKGVKLAREQLKLDRERGELIERREADAQLAAFARWCTSAMDRAGSELASALAGRKPGEIKRIVSDYFDRARREALDRS